jgi:heat shock protein HslJ
MKQRIQLCLAILLLLSCGRPDAVNTREEMNESVEGVPFFIPDQADSSLYGVYRGVLAGESGDVLNKLSLYEDNSFFLQQMCEQNSKMKCEYRGKFKYDHDNKSIRFKVDGEVYRFRIEEDLLHLTDKKGNKLQFPVDQTPYLTKSGIQLTNTLWQFESINDSLLSEEIQDNSLMRFHPDGSLYYNLSCNSCRGGWDAQVKGEITLKGGICTKMACVHPYEDQFNQLIRAIRSFQIKGDRLILSTKSKTVAVLKSPF